MNDRQLLTSGILGTTITALCCFTPLLVVVFATLGVSAWLGWVDLVLLPALGSFTLLTLYALVRMMRRRRPLNSDSPKENADV